MALSSEMKNLSEDILASFKQRIKENEDLVNDVQKTLDGFHKDQQDMAAVLNANAVALRKDLAQGEKDRINTYHSLMKGIHLTISSIQKEVVSIQTSTLNMIKEFSSDRVEMAGELNKFFAEGRADRMQNEKTRLKDFDVLMKNINADIKSINEEVLSIFKSTNELLEKFDKEHLDMSAELRADLSKNLTERVQYTKKLLNGFQKRLSEISKENQKMAQKLRKDLDKGEVERLDDYNGIMEEIQLAIKGIKKAVKEVKKATNSMISDYAKDRGLGVAEWTKMQKTIAQLRKTGNVVAKEVPKKVEKAEVKIEAPVEAVKAAPIKEETIFSSESKPVETQPKVETKPVTVALTLEQKVLEYINKHPKGVKISEMEEPMGETRMKLGFIAKALQDEGKIQKIDNVYFPNK